MRHNLAMAMKTVKLIRFAAASSFGVSAAAIGGLCLQPRMLVVQASGAQKPS
jgi:hypothetical protein